eukprot:356238-Chlamydomonas_euryale.AAC.1
MQLEQFHDRHKKKSPRTSGRKVSWGCTTALRDCASSSPCWRPASLLYHIAVVKVKSPASLRCCARVEIVSRQ